VIVVGSPISNQKEAGANTLIGVFIEGDGDRLTIGRADIELRMHR
jgi:hypothetical protein